MGREDAVPECCHWSESNLTFVLPITRTLLPIEQAHVIFYIQGIASVVSRLLSFQSKLLPLFDDRVSGVTGTKKKIQTGLPVICARMCTTAPPSPPSPMVVVYGIARITAICSAVEAVFSVSCMNHVGVVHSQEGERD